MMDVKQARKTAVETILKNSCNNYLYAYLRQRELQPDSLIISMPLEHSGYKSELIEQQELVPNAKIALDSFEVILFPSYNVFDFTQQEYLRLLL